MKKMTGILLAVILLLGILAGCKKEGTKTAQPPAETSGTSTTTPGGLEDSIFDDDTTAGQQNQSPTDATQGQETPSSPTVTHDSNVQSLDYESFRALTPAQQREYQESFPSMDAFFEWYNAAYEAYKEDNPPTIIDGSGTVTLP